MTNNGVERQFIEIVATDRIYKPIASIDGKLKRRREKLAKAVDLEVDESYDGERVHARVEQNEVMKARTMRAAVEGFAAQYPRHGKILQGMIEEQRETNEVHMYFGLNKGCRLTAEDYIGVMTELGFTEATAERLYPELMNISYKLARKREEGDRSLMLTQSFK